MVGGARSPHYENALKYASALSVSMWGAYNGQHRKDGLWQVRESAEEDEDLPLQGHADVAWWWWGQTAFVLATLYQYYWDVFNDWGLLQWCVPQPIGPWWKQPTAVLVGVRAGH